jgi:hypothetical protein
MIPMNLVSITTCNKFNGIENSKYNIGKPFWFPICYGFISCISVSVSVKLYPVSHYEKSITANSSGMNENQYEV